MSQLPTKYSSSFLIVVLLLQQLLSALAFPITKYGLAFIDPFVFAFYRFMIASLFLLVVVLLQKNKIKIQKKDYPKIMGLGVLIILFNQVLFLVGQSYTTASHGSLLFATMPIWVFLTAFIHLKERPSTKRIIGICIALGGVATVMISGAVSFGSEYLLGDLLILIAVIAWAYYTIFGKILVKKYGALRITAYALSFGSLLYLPFGLYVSIKFNYSVVPFNAWWSVLYMALGTSVIAYVLWYWVLKQMEASRIALFQNIQPFMAAGVAYLWLGEPLSGILIVGGLIAISGILIAEV